MENDEELNENKNAIMIFGPYWTKTGTVSCELNYLYVFNSLLTYLFSVNFLSVGFIARIEIIFPVPIGTASGTEKGTLCVIIMNWMVKGFQHNFDQSAHFLLIHFILYLKAPKNSELVLISKERYLLPKLFYPTVRKNCSSDREKKFEIQGWRLRICKNFEI